GGIWIQYGLEEALVAAIIEDGEQAKGPVIELIVGALARKIRQPSAQEVRVHTHLRLFFPQPRPSSGSWQMGQRRGGRARGANLWAGRAGRLRPPAVPPDQSRGGCTDRRVAPDQRGRHESTCDTSYRSVANR